MDERGTGPKSLMEEMNGCRELGCCSTVCLCCVLIGSRFDGFVMVQSGLALIDLLHGKTRTRGTRSPL